MPHRIIREYVRDRFWEAIDEHIPNPKEVSIKMGIEKSNEINYRNGGAVMSNKFMSNHLQKFGIATKGVFYVPHELFDRVDAQLQAEQILAQ